MNPKTPSPDYKFDIPAALDDIRMAVKAEEIFIERAKTELSPKPKPTPGLEINETVSYRFDPFMGIDNLVDVWYMMHPDTKLYPWQHQELLRLSGYIDGTKTGPRLHWTPDAPFMGNYVCCNDAGKDLVLIKTVAVGMPLLYRDVIVVITSSSHVQLKNQTQNHIERGIQALNARCGTKIFDSIEFYHSCPQRGGEINLFATDEPGRAEGWHPRTKRGRLVMIKNEDKSIPEDIQTALDRCHGYSHWLNVSSPGPRRGKFFRVCKLATEYPKRPEPFKFWKRKVDWTQCPHISPQLFELKVIEYGLMSYFVQTSFLANFYEQEEDTAVPNALLLSMDGRFFKPNPLDIGIGLDSAGGGDETAIYVRFGPVHTRKLFFREKDTIKAADRVHDFLKDLQDANRFGATLAFNYDDGGMSRTFGDQLVKRGWLMTRRLNQAKSTIPARFANLGTQMYWHTRELLERGQIQSPEDETTRMQLTSRKYDEAETLGKKCLVSKKETAVLIGGSPDRADAFVLCNFSFRPDRFYQPDPHDFQRKPANIMTKTEFLAKAEADPNFLNRIHRLLEKEGGKEYANTLLRTNSIQ